MMAKMSPMVSMAIDDDPADFGMVSISGINSAKPRFPYELRICLTEKEMEKLDLDHSEAFIGGLVHLHAMARITSLSSHENEGSTGCRIEMQIEDLKIESEDEENSEEE